MWHLLKMLLHSILNPNVHISMTPIDINKLFFDYYWQYWECFQFLILPFTYSMLITVDRGTIFRLCYIVWSRQYDNLLDISRNSLNVTEYANIELRQHLGNLQYVCYKLSNFCMVGHRNSSIQLTLTTGHAVSTHRRNI